jgi:hypothetical protein
MRNYDPDTRVPLCLPSVFVCFRGKVLVARIEACLHIAIDLYGQRGKGNISDSKVLMLHYLVGVVRRALSSTTIQIPSTQYYTFVAPFIQERKVSSM